MKRKHLKSVILAIPLIVVTLAATWKWRQGCVRERFVSGAADNISATASAKTRGMHAASSSHGLAPKSASTSSPGAHVKSAGSRGTMKLRDRFAGYDVVAERRYSAGTNTVERERLVRSGPKYRYLRVVDRLAVDSASGSETLLSQVAMVGDHVAVHLRQGFSESDLRQVMRNNGFSLRRRMRMPGCYLVAGAPVTLDLLKNLTNALSAAECVDIAEPDYVVYPCDSTPDDAKYSSLWGMPKIGMPKVWDMTTGNGSEVVAVFDTGTDLDHPDLVNRLWHNPNEIPGNGIDDDDNGYVDDVYGWDFYSEDNDPNDVYGHGSHVAGTAAAEGNNSEGVTGVGWDLRIMTIKFFGRNVYGELEGFASDAMDGMYYVITEKTKNIPVHVTNHSWGGPGFSYLLRDAMEIAGGQGIMHVVAAGNNGALNNDTDPQYPASYDLSNIVAVANTTQSDALNAASHYGAVSVDLGAPGTSIYSISMGGGYKYMSGTSMASPHVAGAAALMFAYMPELSWEQVRSAIFAGTDPLSSLSGKCVTGGRLNLFNALKMVGPFISHTPLSNTTTDDSEYIVSAEIKPSVPLTDTNMTVVLWNTTGLTNSFFTSVVQRVTNDIFQASIPAQPLGSTVYYMIKAETTEGRIAADPADAPASLHSFAVTEPEDFTVYGTPGNYGSPSPDYGEHVMAYGSDMNITAPLYTVPDGNRRYRCEGWYGGGDVPPIGETNSVTFTITRSSAVMWRWVTQYSLIQTANLTGVVNTTSWWDSAGSAMTVYAPPETEINGTNYALTCWLVDGVRYPGITNAALNPATGITMNSGRSATASYIPVNRDDDGDGLPDWWELFYFADTNQNASADPDGDGFVNSLEYADRSDPRDAQSVPSGPNIQFEPLPDPMPELSPWHISASVTDSVGVAEVSLNWRRGTAAWNILAMPLASDGSYTSAIPAPHSIGDTFSYRITAVDNAGNTNSTALYSFTVKYPVAAVAPAQLDINLARPSDVQSAFVITNSGNAVLNWEMVTDWHDGISQDEAGWSHSGQNDLWHISTAETYSAPYAWYCGSDTDESYHNSMDAELVTPTVTLGADPVLTFQQWFFAEYDGRAGYEKYFWDGGVVDISTNGGVSFERITPVGGYPYKITPNDASPFPAHTPCLSGTGGWEQVSFDLAAYAGKDVSIRFRFGADAYTVARGWFIDDLQLSWSTAWLDMAVTSGAVTEHTAVNCSVDVNASALQPGLYHNSITLDTDSPENPIIKIPVTLLIRSYSNETDIRFDRNNDMVIVSWQADAFHRYSLMKSENLSRILWSGIPGYTDITGVDGIMSYTGSLNNASSSFYRVDEH